jgi:TPR repeat protein
MYLNGIGTPRNANEAVKWFEKAGETWEPRSMITLADLYLDGTKIEKNEEIAFKWYLRSAEIGNQKAQFQIATMYRDGIGTEQNSEESEIWFMRYSHSTLSAHQIFMADMLNKGIAVEGDYTQSVELFTKAVESGNLYAMFQLGLFYRDSLKKQNMKLASEFFKRAADLGHMHSQLNYADMLFRGLGVEQNFEQSATYYKLASKNRNATAFLRLSIIETDNIALSKENLQHSLKLDNKDALQFK